jgi:hypothetical protein
MFGLFGNRKAKIEKAAYGISNHMNSIFALQTPISEFVSDKIITSPYHSSFFQTLIGSFTMFLIKAKELKEDDSNEVSGMVLSNIFGRNRGTEISQSIQSHQRQYIGQKSSDWYTGIKNGMKFAKYWAKVEDYRNEPDLTKAYDRLKQMSDKNLINMDNLNDFEKAMMGLKVLWFDGAKT